MNYKLFHKEQDQDACIFNDFTKALIVYTNGFKNAFGTEAEEISFYALDSIIQRYGNRAEYLQVFEYNGIKFWVINDRNEVVTMMLPEEY